MAEFNGFEPVIGLEVHAQLSTESKIFCTCRNLYGEAPNSLTCPVCLGLPGALPVLNSKAVDYAMRMILGVGGTIQLHSVFSRKNYFYPDLPKGYQISQYDLPIGLGGEVRYRLDGGEVKTCRIKRIHLEEDAGKSLHPEGGESFTRVDLNRCGAPLIEIVSEPDLRSPQEAYGYLVKMKQILRYVDVCSGDMEKGHLRCDANVSVRPVGSPTFGTRTELKNMNSFKAVERAIQFEIERQVGVITTGGTVQQESLLWNEKKQAAEMMRSKEESHDYRYFPEPDLPTLDVSAEHVESVRNSLPELPDARAARFVSQYDIREYDALVLTESIALANYFEEVMRSFSDGRSAANWIQTEVLGTINQTGEDISTYKIPPVAIADLLLRVQKGEISGKIAKTVFAEMTQSGKNPAAIIAEQGLAQISGEDALIPVIDQVIASSPDNVEKYRSGKTNVFAFFVGQVMKATRGQANPEVVNRLLREKLDGGA
ncbi:MAG: Asp-tRNA(Asn)/Glu-tRNA(Gln) amidotransferase subunit GatB [Candidatus Zixiibacteriota bacterium]